MDLSKYLNKKVRIDLTIQSYYYEGIVLSVDENSISLRDRKGQLVTLSTASILFIREVV